MAFYYGNPTWIYQDDITSINELSSQSTEAFRAYLGMPKESGGWTFKGHRFLSEDGVFECIAWNTYLSNEQNFDSLFSLGFIDGTKECILNGHTYNVFAPTKNDCNVIKEYIYKEDNRYCFISDEYTIDKCWTIEFEVRGGIVYREFNRTSPKYYKPIFVRRVIYPIISLTNENLEDMINWSNINYNIKDGFNNTATVKEYIDDTLINTYSNIQTPSNRQIVIDSNKWKNLSYGKHTIKIEAIDSKGGLDSKVITFNKIKAPVTTLPTTSSLKLSIAHNKEIEKEVDYQCFRLSSYLKEKGINVAESEKLATLIDKVRKIKSKTVASDNQIEYVKYVSSTSTGFGMESYGGGVEYLCTLNGSLRVETFLRYADSRVKIIHMRGDSEIFNSGLLTGQGRTFSFDIDNIKQGDKILMLLASSINGRQVYADFWVKGDVV